MGAILPEWLYAAWFAFAAVACGVFLNYVRKSNMKLKSLRWQLGVGLLVTSAASMFRAEAIWIFLVDKRSPAFHIPSAHELLQIAVSIATVMSALGWFIVIRAMSFEECGERGWVFAACIAVVLASIAIAL